MKINEKRAWIWWPAIGSVSVGLVLWLGWISTRGIQDRIQSLPNSSPLYKDAVYGENHPPESKHVESPVLVKPPTNPSGIEQVPDPEEVRTDPSGIERVPDPKELNQVPDPKELRKPPETK